MPGTGSKCPECGMIFRVPSNLAKHRRRIHRDFAARQESSNTCASCFACIVRLFRNCFSLSTRKGDDRDYKPQPAVSISVQTPIKGDHPVGGTVFGAMPPINLSAMPGTVRPGTN